MLTRASFFIHYTTLTSLIVLILLFFFFFPLSTARYVPAFLQRVSRAELIDILERYGETTDPTAARRVADAVCLARDAGSLPSRTKEFAALVAAAKGKEYQAMHPAKLTFQALRVHLNQEFDEMKRGMRAAVDVMPDGGRLGVLTVGRPDPQCFVFGPLWNEHRNPLPYFFRLRILFFFPSFLFFLFCYFLLVAPPAVEPKKKKMYSLRVTILMS